MIYPKDQLNYSNGQNDDYHFKVEELSGGMKTPTAVTEIQAQVQMGELGGFTTIDRHIYFFDTFFVLMERDDLKDFQRLKGADGQNQCPLEVRDDIADYVFLFDRQTFWNRTSKKEVLIENRSRELRITAKSKDDMFKILLFFHAMRRIYCTTHGLDINSTFDDSLEDNKYPYRSFSAVRPNTPVKWYVCGADYMEAAAEAMENATKRIFICDWQMSPCVYLKRPFNSELNIHVPDDYWRLDNLLKRKANQGVRIYILLYQDPNAMGLGNYEASKYLRRFNRQEGNNHGNIFCLTHPDSEGPMNWAHHEKLIVCDEEIAFVSGIDLSIGRWELHGQYPLYDNGEVKTWKGNDYWNQFNVKPACNIIDDSGNGWEDDRLDRGEEMRVPWHDIGSSVLGLAASDCGRHFIERWNSHIYYCFKSAVKLNTPGLRRFRIPTIGESMAKQIIVPRLLSEIPHQGHAMGGIPIAGMPVASMSVPTPVYQLEQYTPAELQILRSSSTWSAGLGNTDCSILNAYLDLIENAQKFIFIENQFFVTSTGNAQTGAQNQIGRALADRVVKASRNQENFKIYIVIPCVPGMNGRLEENNAQAQEVLIHLTMESINRGKSSIKGHIEDNGVHDWENYIWFTSYRKWDVKGDVPVHEIIYPHSKLMIVDDFHTIIGSSNINDRNGTVISTLKSSQQQRLAVLRIS